MPIRINLKELFGTDSQTITVDKLNFNFNKLLELGVGLPGPKGPTGPKGPAGPKGLTGDTGEDGNHWFVGSGNPNSGSFTNLLDEDFYLDTATNEIWQYNGSVWNLLIDFENIIDNYLAASGSAFIRGLGDISPEDDRYIMFTNRGNTTAASASDSIGGSSENDILFLNNFNEKYSVVDIDNFPSDTNDLYTAIQKIFTDQSSGVPGRYHFELGSLFADSNGSSTNLLSSLKHNVKFRHLVDDLGGSPQYPSTNDYLYIGKISMSKTETQSISELNYNSIFEFNVSKYNNEGSPTVNKEVNFRYGAKEGLGEFYSASNVDGLNISISSGETAEFGISFEYSSNSPAANDKDLALVTSNVDGIMLDGEVLQERGSIRQLGSTGFTDVDTVTSISSTTPNSLGIHHNLGIASQGNQLYVVSGKSPMWQQLADTPQDLDDSDLSGIIQQFNIEQSPLTSNTANTFDSSVFDGSDPEISGAGLCDIVVNGEYAYLITSQIYTSLTEDGSGLNSYYQRGLQIAYLNNSGQTPEIVSPNGTDWSAGLQLSGAWRAAMVGKYLAVGCNLLRDFGSVVDDDGNTMNDPSSLKLIDVSDPASPRVELSVSLDPGENVLDMVTYDNYVIVLTLEWLFGGALSFGNPIYATGYKIHTKIYEATEVFGSMFLKSEATILTVGSDNVAGPHYNINTGNFYSEVIPKVGTITTDGKNIYSSFNDRCYILGLDDLSASGLSLETNIQYDTTVISGARKSYDSKKVGDSLYILHGGDASSSVSDKQYSSESTYITKILMDSTASPTIEWTQEVDNAGTRFEIIGNKAYVATQSASSGGGSPTFDQLAVTEIELDGIESNHIQAGSIKASEINTTVSLNTGGHSNISGNLHVGQGARINGDAAVGKTLAVHELGGTSGSVSLYRNSTTGILSASSSDVRLKTNVSQITGALDKILNLRGVYFNWQEAEGFKVDPNAGLDIGMIAQEVELIVPELVALNGIKDYKTINYEKTVALLVEGIKEQQEQIEALKEEIELLKGN